MLLATCCPSSSAISTTFVARRSRACSLSFSSRSARDALSDFSEGGDLWTGGDFPVEAGFESDESGFAGGLLAAGGGVTFSLADMKDRSDRDDSELSLDGPDG